MVLKVLPEVLFTTTVSLDFFSNCYMIQLFDKALQSMISGGIPQWKIKFYAEYFWLTYVEPPPEPQVLSIDDLNFGFVIWLVALGLSSLSFLCEILCEILKKSLKVLKDFLNLITFLVILRKFRSTAAH